LRPAGIALDSLDVGTHPIANTKIFLRDHLVARKSRLDFSGFDNGVATLHALDGAGNQCIAALKEVGQDLFAFRIPNSLEDYLLGVLRKAATKVNGLDWLLNVIIHIDVVDLFFGFEMEYFLVRQLQTRFVRHDVPAAEGLEHTGFAVDRHANVDLAVIALLGRLGECVLQRAEHDILVHIFFARQRIDQQ
jgi:hypothetical protein